MTTTNDSPPNTDPRTLDLLRHSLWTHLEQSLFHETTLANIPATNAPSPSGDTPTTPER